MAKLGDIEVANRSASYKSGAALLLNDKPSQDQIIRTISDWEVEIEEDNPFIIARTENQLMLDNVLSSAHEAIQKALDKICIRADGDYQCRNVDSKRIVWWREGEEQYIRVISIATFGASTSVAATVKTSSGESKSKQSPQTEWHESQRYFRLAQTSDNLFNAYRNMFLAFENILSHRVPPDSGEGEKDWLKRALKDTHNEIDLSEFAQDESNVIDSIFREQYEDIRVKMFHAKQNRSRLVPQNKEDRNKVQEALENLSQLVLYLIRNSISVNRSSGAITYHAFNRMMPWIEDNSNIQAVLSESTTPFRKDESLESDPWQNRVTIPAKYSQKLSEPGLKSVLGKVNKSELREEMSIRRIGLVRKESNSQNRLISVEYLEESLILEEIDYFESQLGIILKNLKTIKKRFPS